MADGNERDIRIQEYQRRSLEADELVGEGQNESAVAILRECLAQAASAGDEDYRLFCEAEILSYTQPDHPQEIHLMEEAFEWQAAHGLRVDASLLRNMGV